MTHGTQEYIADELLERIEQNAIHLASGEQNPELRLIVQNSAFNILADRLRKPVILPRYQKIDPLGNRLLRRGLKARLQLGQSCLK